MFCVPFKKLIKINKTTQTLKFPRRRFFRITEAAKTNDNQLLQSKHSRRSLEKH